MLVTDLPDERKHLIVQPSPVELVLAEEGGIRLALVLPPYEDLAAIKNFKGSNFSLKEHAEQVWAQFRKAFAIELEYLKSKHERFRDSATFVTHLANLAELAGDRIQEEEILKASKQIDRDALLKHRLAENILAQHRPDEAEAMFSKMDLEHDKAANLRIAYFHANRRNFEKAEASVARALAIDPVDYGARLFEGGLNLAQGRFEEAVQSFRIAMDERPASSVLHSNLAIAYVFLQQPGKAIQSLKKAVAFDPVNENAVSLLADLANAENMSEEAIPSLRYFVQLEQKSSSMWGRLARATLAIGAPHDAVAALRRQASLEDTPSVWNNLGVAHISSGNRKLALEAFKHAITRDSRDEPNDSLLPLRNVIAMLVEEESYEDVVRIARIAIKEDSQEQILHDRTLSDIYAYYINALAQLGMYQEAARESERILAKSEIARSLRVALNLQLLSYYTVSLPSLERATSLADSAVKLLEKTSDVDESKVNSLANNIAFTYLEAGRTSDAEGLLHYFTKSIHKDAFQTATLGLLHLRKDHLDRGTVLYQEAIRLAKRAGDKERIRQKLNLELGRYWLKRDTSKAKRYLEKVRSSGIGARQIVNTAKQLLALPPPELLTPKKSR